MATVHKLDEKAHADVRQLNLTKAEEDQFERIAVFVLPMMRAVARTAAQEVKAQLGAARAADDATATFAREYASVQMALDALPDGVSPMARVELELRQRELAAAFVATHAK